MPGGTPRALSLRGRPAQARVSACLLYTSGVVAQPFLEHARSGAVDGLEHGVAVADVGAARRADTALQLRGLIGDDRCV